jgi:hypothetical protein
MNWFSVGDDLCRIIMRFELFASIDCTSEAGYCRKILQEERPVVVTKQSIRPCTDYGKISWITSSPRFLPGLH